jgi:L-aspartate oxidase
LLATGGFAGLFAATSTTADCDGSAQAIALEAGAELADLEFVQFHPTALAGPGRNHLITEAIRGAGGYILDLNGRRFLFDADPRGELAPRSTVTRAIVEKQAGRAGGVFLDVRHLHGAVLTARFPGFMRRCRERGIDPRREAVPIAPAAHYTMGGIVTDLDGRTSVAGLFAAGECARVGVHGANRLASNSLLEAVVYGPRAARAALAELRPIRGAALALSARSQLSAPIPAWISRVLSLSAGPVRSSVEIERGLGQLREGRTVGWQADAARTIGSLVLKAALLRQESRGAHYRADCPNPAQGWNELEVVSAAGATGAPDVRFRRRRGAGTALELGPQSLAPVATECLPGVETPGSLR